MVVGVGRLQLLLPESHSLKEKRRVLRRIKDRVRLKFNLAIAEVADNDLWQSAVLGIAVVGNQRRFVESMLESIRAYVSGEAELIGDEQELIEFGDSELAPADGGARWEPETPSPVARFQERPRPPGRRR